MYIYIYNTIYYTINISVFELFLVCPAVPKSSSPAADVHCLEWLRVLAQDGRRLSRAAGAWVLWAILTGVETILL